MARYKNGINGPISGKVGSVVAVNWRGIDILRGRPKPIIKAPSVAQLDQRRKFALICSWLEPLRDLIWTGYQFFTGSKTPMNGAVSYHLTGAVTGESPDFKIDFPKAIFSRGELLVSLLREVTTLVDAVLLIKWDNGPASVFCSEDDEASFVWYNPVKQKFATFYGVAKRADQEVVLQLPADFAGDVVHGYMQYVNRKGDKVSTTVYLGEILL